MRRLLTCALLVPVLATGLVALPTVTTAGAAPRPVSAELEQVRLTGVDATALARLPRPAGPAPALLSAPLTGKRFSLMGVTWRPDPSLGEVEVQVRTRADGRWSAWESVEADTDDAPDAGSVDTGSALRAGTAPIWTGPADGAQVRVDADGRTPRDVRIELVDPGTSPADAQVVAPRASAGAAEPRPAILTRAQWGADESIRRGSPSYSPTVKVGFIHHTASSNSYTADQAAAMVRGIYAYHVKSNGWSDIGYNFLVDRYGRAYEGRAGGMDRFVTGAHTGGFNYNSFGVSLLGDFSTVPPSSSTLATLEKVLAWKLGSAYRNPLGKAVLTSAGGGTSKFSSGTQVTFNVVSGHRDAGNTSCPGQTTYDRIGTIRQATAAYLGAGFVDPVRTGDAQYDLGERGTVGVRAGTVGGVAWSATVTEARTGAVVKRATGTGGTAAVSWDLTVAGAPARPGSYVLKLAGANGADPALAYAQTVVVEAPVCRGTPLQRAICRGQVRTAKG